MSPTHPTFAKTTLLANGEQGDALPRKIAVRAVDVFGDNTMKIMEVTRWL